MKSLAFMMMVLCYFVLLGALVWAHGPEKKDEMERVVIHSSGEIKFDKTISEEVCCVGMEDGPVRTDRKRCQGGKGTKANPTKRVVKMSECLTEFEPYKGKLCCQLPVDRAPVHPNPAELELPRLIQWKERCDFFEIRVENFRCQK